LLDDRRRQREHLGRKWNATLDEVQPPVYKKKKELSCSVM
jgi:hypothetical protein